MVVPHLTSLGNKGAFPFVPPDGLGFVRKNHMTEFFSGPQSEIVIVDDPLTGEYVLLLMFLTSAMLFGIDVTIPSFHLSFSSGLCARIVLQNSSLSNRHVYYSKPQYSCRCWSLGLLCRPNLLYINTGDNCSTPFFVSGKNPNYFNVVIHGQEKESNLMPPFSTGTIIGSSKSGQDVGIYNRDSVSMDIKNISYQVARDFVAQHHYARKSPSTVRFSHGIFIGSKLIGVLMWGYGTRPLHTIKKIFPSLRPPDYLELCRFCVHDSMPRNTESHILRLSREKIIHDNPEIKVLFSWADGMRGKPGFVYQSDNWLFGGFIISEFYRNRAGEVVHPRQLITRYGRRDKAFARRLGFTKYRGPQFRYIRFICGHKERKRLLRESPFDWSLPYPKMRDLFLYAGQGSRVSRTATSSQGLVRFQGPAPRCKHKKGR